MKKFSVAVVGATGAVGRMMLKVLEERKFPVGNLKVLASERSAGRKSLSFNRKSYGVERLDSSSFKGVQIALFSAGAERSKEFAPHAVKAGTVVVDNSSAFRYQDDVPLVVPEVNPADIKQHKGIIANPNCSTIQLVAVLHPIHQAVRIRRVVVSTYQSVSGAGAQAMKKLETDSRNVLEKLIAQESALEQNMTAEVFQKNQQRPASIAFNCVPHIDVFEDNGYTREEMKMVRETRKVMGESNLSITTTAVRVPVFYSHSESVNIETDEPLSPAEARRLLGDAPGVEVVDDPSGSQYPLATECGGRDPVFVGRIRKDETVANGLNLWIVSDNLRKGAALNAVQIAEALIPTL